MNNGQIIFLDYPVNPEPRYGYGKPPHPELTEILNRNAAVYQQYLKSFLQYKDDLVRIPKTQSSPTAAEPAWINGWLPGLDSVAIYGFLALHNPQRYFEIGSGNSTKFARRAIQDHGLQTKIISVDPHPRAEIDALCDTVIRQPVEQADLSVFQELEAGDILFVDHSHRSFTNSDATVVFLEILPRLKPGVLVEFHDILLPFDYPPEWKQRFYNEQYLLACYLLAEGSRFETILPNLFISRHIELNKILSPLWEAPEMQGVETHGGSFWIRMK
ncbi:MAG: class I SAM-dependent methyltransferase [Bacillota bacterium]